MPQDGSNVEMRFENLNSDVLFLIFMEMDLPELISMAKTKAYFSLLAVDVFKRKYLKKSVKIHDPFYEWGNGSGVWWSGDSVNYKVVDDGVVIKHYDTILNVLKLFGHVISRLDVTYSSTYEETDISNISSSINLYCSNTLTELYIDSFQEKFFENMSKPFIELRTVSIKGEFSAFDSNLKFEELFPAVRDLTYLPIFISDGNAINRVFVHLQSLHVHIWELKKSWRFTQDDVEALLRKNPQIRSVKFNYCTRPFLKIVSEILPNLQELEIDNYRNALTGDNGEPITFKNVTYFAVRTGAESAPQNIFFPRLHEFFTNVFPRNCYKWIDFVRNCTTLKILQVSGAFITNEQLGRLAERSLDLDEVHIQLNTNVNDETIIEFVTVNKNIGKILFSKQKKSDSLMSIANTIRSNFGNKWKITETKYEMLLESTE